jgi:hypothetical protein
MAAEFCLRAWDRRLYFPSEGRRATDFITLKIHRPRPGLNPRTLGPVASTLTTRPPRATKDYNIRDYNFTCCIGCENWCLTLREEHSLRVCVKRSMRWILKPREEVIGGGRNLRKQEFNSFYSSPNIIREIRGKMDGACSTHGRDDKLVWNFSRKIWEEITWIYR